MNKNLYLILRNMHDDLYHLQRNDLQNLIATYQDIYGGVQSSLEKWLLEPTEENWIVFTRQADIMERSFPKIDLDGIRDLRQAYTLAFSEAQKEETFDLEEIRDELPYNAIEQYYSSFC